MLFARWFGKQSELRQAYEKKYHLNPLTLKKLLPDDMKREAEQSGLLRFSPFFIYWMLLTFSFEPLVRLTSETEPASLYGHFPEIFFSANGLLILVYLARFDQHAGDRLAVVEEADLSLIRLSALFHKLGWGVFGALLVALLFHSDLASFWDWLSLAIPLNLVLATSKYINQFAVHENGFRLTVYFVPWKQITWYRWYDRAEAIIFGTQQPIVYSRYFILEMPDESREQLATLIDEKLSGKRLEDVEEVLASEPEKEIGGSSCSSARFQF